MSAHQPIAGPVLDETFDQYFGVTGVSLEDLLQMVGTEDFRDSSAIDTRSEGLRKSYEVLGLIPYLEDSKHKSPPYNGEVQGNTKMISTTQKLPSDIDLQFYHDSMHNQGELDDSNTSAYYRSSGPNPTVIGSLPIHVSSPHIQHQSNPIDTSQSTIQKSKATRRKPVKWYLFLKIIFLDQVIILTYQ